jgi:hypothetical protein
MVTGNLVPGVVAPTCTYDTYNRYFSNRLMLFAGDTGIDLISIEEKLKILKAFLLDWIDQTPSFKRVEGKTLIFKIQLKAANKPL